MKKHLLDSAQKLNQPSVTAAEEFSNKRELLVADCNRIFSSRTDLDQLIGPGNLQMAKDNNHNFARFMAAVFYDYHPDILVQTVLWVFRAYRAHGFHTLYWAANLNIWLERLKSDLSEQSFNEINPFYNWLIIHIPTFTELTDASEYPNENGNPIHGTVPTQPL